MSTACPRRLFNVATSGAASAVQSLFDLSAPRIPCDSVDADQEYIDNMGTALINQPTGKLDVDTVVIDSADYFDSPNDVLDRPRLREIYLALLELNRWH